jgi:predicted thioesterase
MKESLKVGLTSTVRHDIDPGRCIEFMGDDCRVYATPFLLYDLEYVCRDLLKEHLDESLDSVGTRVELDHVGATLAGMWVEITATIAELNGNAVVFEFTARDNLEEVARGKHHRFIVGLEKTAARLRAKAQKAAQAVS